MAREGGATTENEVNATFDATEEEEQQQQQVDEGQEGEEEGGGEEDGEEDEQEEEEEEEEEDEAQGEGEYTFRFTNGMSPLDFVHNNDSGVSRYRQFERLEYEAVAARERKALADSHPEGTSSNKATEDGNAGASIAELTRMLGDATLHYACGHHDQAIAVLHEVIRLAPNLPDSYHVLGLVYRSLEDYNRAMDFYMIAAHLTPKDSSLWKMLFTWSIEQGDVGQASYCLSKAITADPKDITLRTHRASFYVELGDYQKAAAAYEQGTDASQVNGAMDLAPTFGSMKLS